MESSARILRNPADVRDPDADLDCERTRERLAHSDAFAHLVFRQPLLLADQLALHLTDEGDRAAETEQPEPQEVSNEVANRNALGGPFVILLPTVSLGV